MAALTCRHHSPFRFCRDGVTLHNTRSAAFARLRTVTTGVSVALVVSGERMIRPRQSRR
jgi:hypothetical protein